ncbi:MAG TPA: hypothetical protein VEI99_06690 [Terriglobales bacterium]|nr:hypothetical protein [Terriglobales bacterium]
MRVIVQCANPACAAPLRYLFDGRLFQFGVRSHDADAQLSTRKARRVAHFWLCGQCSSTFSLTFDLREGVKVVPLVPVALTKVAGERFPAEP